MLRFRGIHWMAPTVMTTSLLGALGMALGHHFFYNDLANKKVASGSYNIAGKHLSRQQFNVAVGTAFAFLVRLLLGVACSTAFVQLFWRSAKYAKTPTLKELDWADDVVSNFFQLFNAKKWWRFPSLALAALVLWSVPIATIFPPATLTVENLQENTSTPLRTPNLDFATFAYAANLSPQILNDSNVWAFGGNSQPIQNLAFSVAASGKGLVPSLYPASPTHSANATWELNSFYSPALQCNHVIGDERVDIWKNIWNSYNWTDEQPPVFLSWTPWSQHDGFNRDNDGFNGAGFNLSGPNPFDRDLPYFITPTGMTGPSSDSVSTDGPISFFVAVMPGAYNLTIGKPPAIGGPVQITTSAYSSAGPDISPVLLPSPCSFERMNVFDESFTLTCGSTTYAPASTFDRATLLRCDLLNTSIGIKFDYSKNAAPVSLLRFDNTNNDEKVNGSRYFLAPSGDLFYDNSSVLASQTCIPFLADPFAVVGGDRPREALRQSCDFDSQSLRLLSYQSIMAAFHDTFRGNITSSMATSSKIVDTLFMQTSELNWLRNLIGDPDNVFSLPHLYDRLPAAERFRATAGSSITADQGSLATAMGETFERMVLSLFAEEHFYPNYSSPFAPPSLTNVTTQSYQNIYVYDAFTLWISYGLGIFFTTLVVTAGWVALSLNGSSYSRSFSTILRVGRTAEMSVEIKPEDASGCDPLAEYLEHARVNIGDLDNKGGTVRRESKRAPEAQSLVADSDNASSWAEDTQEAVLQSGDPQQERRQQSRQTQGSGRQSTVQNGGLTAQDRGTIARKAVPSRPPMASP